MADLERRLAAAAPYADFPPTPDLASAARGRLPERRQRRRLRIAMAFAVVLAALAGAILALSPGARSAIVDLLDRIPGIEIERVAELPDAPYRSTPDYGVEVSLDEAERHFGRPLLLPRLLGTPDRFYWGPSLPGDMITAVYGNEKRARAVFSQWKVGTPLLYKAIAPGTGVEPVIVAPGTPGVWMHGREHAVFYLSRNQDDRFHYAQEGHLAGNVLAWHSTPDVVYRLEAQVTRGRALEIARSLEPIRRLTAMAARAPRLRETLDVAVEPRGTLLVSDLSNRVFRVRGRTLTVVARAGFPVEVAVDPRGGFGIVSAESRILLVNARGRLSVLGRRLAQPTALSFDAAGNVYFSELGGRVMRIDRASRAVAEVARGFDRPHGQAVVGGTLYVCDTFANRLVAIDLATREITTVAADFNQPVDVAVEPSGTLVVADYGNNRIARVAGGAVTTVAAMLGPQSVAVGRAGTIYSTELHLSRVRAVNPTTGAVRTVVGSP
jgi:hypothetical protein